MPAAHVAIEDDRQPYTLEKRMLPLGGIRLERRGGAAVRVWTAWPVFSFGFPRPRHSEEMPLQSRATNVAYQLHALCCQAQALKLPLS